MPAAPSVPGARNSITARTWFPLTYGSAALRAWMPWPSLTATATTWAACPAFWPISGRANCGSAPARGPRRWSGYWPLPGSRTWPWWNCGFGGAHVRVLSPPRGWLPAAEPRNNDSLVLRFACRNTAFLLEGNAESKMEPALAAQHPQAGLLKVAHNGSASSTSAQFLAAVRPDFAVISVGARNPFRHPRAEVLNRLQTYRIATYRTDQSGAVTFYLDGVKVTPASLPR